MNRINLLFVAALSVALSAPTWALRSDRKQPIDIKADRVEISERDQVSHYYGNVQMQQGSMRIDADEVVVYLQESKLHKIVIIGKPAHFEQQADNQQAIVKSTAEHMEYLANQERLILRKNAEVIQGPNRFRGDFIEYDTLTSTVRAHKEQDSDARVHAIIQPADKEEAPATPTTPGQQ